MATITKTQLDAFVPEIWSAEVLLARMEKHFMAKRVMGVMKDGMRRGDKVWIPTIGNLAVNDVGPGGTVNPQASTETAYQVTVNKWREASVDIDDEARTEPSFDPLPIYSKQIGGALARDVEDALLALYPTLFSNGQYVTDSTTNIDEDAVIAGIVKLDTADVPEEDRFFIIRPAEKGALLKAVEFTSRDYVDGRPKQSWVIGQYGGMPILTSSRVVRADYDGDATAETVNIMWHMEAFGIALQKTPRVQPLAKTKLSDMLVGDQRYGVNNLRINHAVIVGSTNAT